MSKKYTNKDKAEALKECRSERKKYQIGSKVYKDSCFCKTKPKNGKALEECVFYVERAAKLSPKEIKLHGVNTAKLEKDLKAKGWLTKRVSAKSHIECLENRAIKNLIDKKFEIYPTNKPPKCFLFGNNTLGGADMKS